MKHDIAQKTVWITGAGSGIGAAMAAAFAGAGCRLVLTGRREKALEEIASRLDAPEGNIRIRPADIRDRAGIAGIAAGIAEETGLDILCNNAGLNSPRRKWAEIDWESWDELIEVNIGGAMNVIAAALPHMRRQGRGLILNTASWAGRFHSPGAGVPYGASKHALVSLSASINAEENANGIRSTALCPAGVATPLMTRRPGYDPAAADDLIQPDDLAETALYVARMNPGVAVNEIVLSPIRHHS